jgi:hypothetical protein
MLAEEARGCGQAAHLVDLNRCNHTLPCFLQTSALSCVGWPSIAHRPCKSCFSVAVIRCSTASQLSPRITHWLCLPAQAKHSQHIAQHIAQQTSNTHRSFQLLAHRTDDWQALQAKGPNAARLHTLSTAMSNLSSGWHVVRRSRVPLLVVFPGPSSHHTPRCRRRCVCSAFCKEKSQEAPSETRVKHARCSAFC